jgi:hypothetical protein
MKDSINNQYFLDPNLIIFLIKRGMSFKTIAGKLKGLGKVYTDVKGLQEVVYYYHLLGETALGYENAMILRNQTEVLPISNEDILLQESLLDLYPSFPPRELLHSAVLLNNKLTKIICSPESLYGEINGIEVEPVLSRITEQL